MESSSHLSLVLLPSKLTHSHSPSVPTTWKLYLHPRPLQSFVSEYRFALLASLRCLIDSLSITLSKVKYLILRPTHPSRNFLSCSFFYLVNCTVYIPTSSSRKPGIHSLFFLFPHLPYAVPRCVSQICPRLSSPLTSFYCRPPSSLT